MTNIKIRQHTNPRVIRAAARFKPWDYGYMLHIEAKCLAEMAKYFEESDITPDDADSAHYCRLMLKLLAIATDNDISYYTPPKMKFVKDGDLHTIKFVGEGKMDRYVNTANAHRYIQDYQDSPSMRNALRCEKAWHLYNLMRLNCLRHCWD